MLTRISVRNWRAFDTADLALRPGLNVLLGPNGAGKTSWLEAVAFALTGAPVVLPNARLFARAAGQPVQVRVEFQLGERTYGVTRGLTAQARGQVALECGGRRLAEGAEAVTAAIERELGVPPEFLLRVLYMPEGDVYRFLEKPPLAAIDAHLQRVFGLEQIAQIHVAATRVRQEVKRERDSLASLAEQALQRAQVLAEGRARWGDDPFTQQAELRKARERLKAELEAASARRRELQEQAHRLQQTAQALERLAREEAALAGDDPDEAVQRARQQVVEREQAEQQLAQQLADLRAAQRLLADEGTKLRRRAPLDLAADDPELRAQRDAAETVLREIDAALARASAELQGVRDSSAFLTTQPPDGATEPVCPVCRQALPEPLRQRILAENAARERQLREEIARLRARRVAARTGLERAAAALHERLLAAQDARERQTADAIVALESQQHAASQARNEAERQYRAALERRRRLGELAAQRAELLAASGDSADLPARTAAVRQALGEAQQEEARRTQELRQVQEQLATLDGYLQLLAMEGQPPQLLERRRLVLARRELLAELFAAAVQATIDRVRAGALAAAYDEVARAWERFSGWAPVRLEAGAKGKLAVHTAARALELAQLSGGERAAFLVLLHAHLGRHFGRGGFLQLDEPLEHLDADSGQRLLELLRARLPRRRADAGGVGHGRGRGGASRARRHGRAPGAPALAGRAALGLTPHAPCAREIDTPAGWLLDFQPEVEAPQTGKPG